MLEYAFTDVNKYKLTIKCYLPDMTNYLLLTKGRSKTRHQKYCSLSSAFFENAVTSCYSVRSSILTRAPGPGPSVTTLRIFLFPSHRPDPPEKCDTDTHDSLYGLMSAANTHSTQQ